MRSFCFYVFCLSLFFISSLLTAQDRNVDQSFAPSPREDQRQETQATVDCALLEQGMVVQAAHFAPDVRETTAEAEAKEEKAKEKQESQEKRDEVAEQIRVAELQLVEKKAEQKSSKRQLTGQRQR